MNNPEFIIILLNLCILSFSYLWFFPRIAGINIQKLAKYDLLSSLVSLSISSYFFYNSFIDFNAIFFTLNWFWFTFLSFFILEIPFALWYFKKNNILDSFN